LTEPVITVIIITQFNKQGEIKMKKIFKVLTLGAAMGAAVTGFLAAEVDPNGRHIPGTIAIDPANNTEESETRRVAALRRAGFFSSEDSLSPLPAKALLIP
jgi:hypothetical protein